MVNLLEAAINWNPYFLFKKYENIKLYTNFDIIFDNFLNKIKRQSHFSIIHYHSHPKINIEILIL